MSSERLDFKTVLALDIETECNVAGCPKDSKCREEHKHALHPKTSRITCIGVWSPTLHRVFRGANKIQDLTQFVRENPDTQYTGHNLTFDLKHLHFAGFDVKSINWKYDSQLMAHTSTLKVTPDYLKEYERLRVIKNEKLPTGYSHRKASGLSLKVLAPYFLNVDPFWEDPTNHDSDEYVLKDCEYTWLLTNFFYKRLKEDKQFEFYAKYMQPWAKFLLSVELTGVALNQDKINELKQGYEIQEQEYRFQLDQLWEKAHHKHYDIVIHELINEYKEKKLRAIEKLKDPSQERIEKTEQRYAELLKKAISKVDHKINYESPKQMLWLLKDYLGLSVLNFKEEESTGVEVLEKLASTGREDIKLFLKWRGVQKLLSAFIPSYEALALKGVIHPSFHLAGTRTGRLSCSSPNLQQVPSELYCIFKPRPGKVFIGFDMEAIEAKLIAGYSNEPILFDIIQKNQSIHDYNAKTFFNLSCDVSQVKKEYPNERQAAKTVGFALFYGAGKFRIKAALTSAGFPITEEEARQRHEDFKELFRQASEFHKEITKAFEQGDVIPNILGRPIAIQDPADAYMKGFNTLIQSSASDLCLQGAYAAQEDYNNLGLDAKVLMLIHDFIMVEAGESVAEQAATILQKHMTRRVLKTDLGNIPLTVSGGVMGNEWRK